MPLFGPPDIEKMKARRDVKGLIKALTSPKTGNIRYKAAQYLGFIGDLRAVEPLISALKDREPLVGVFSAEALGDIGDPRAVEPLIVALKNGSFELRERAAEALGKIGDPRAVEPLTVALKDSYRGGYRDVGAKAATALGKIGDPRAMEPLIAAVKDSQLHLDVLRRAAEALG